MWEQGEKFSVPEQDAHAPLQPARYESATFTVAMVVANFCVGVCSVLVVGHGGAPSWVWAIALPTAAIASLSLVWRLTRPSLSAAIVILTNFLSISAVPALISTLFLTGMFGSRGRKGIVFSGAVVVGIAQNVVWVFGMGPSRTPAEVFVIILFESITVMGSALSGSMVGHFRRKRDQTQRMLEQTLYREASTVSRVRQRERMRIAKDLHDSIGHRLAVLNIYTSALQEGQHLTDREVNQANSALAEATRGLASDFQKIMTTFNDFDPQEMIPDRDSLTEVIADFRTHADKISITPEIQVDEKAIQTAPVEIGAAVTAFLAESLNNVLKYGAPGVVQVTVFREEEGHTVSASVVNAVSSDGREPITSTGLGLVALRERALLLGGDFSAIRAEGTFTTRLQLPLRDGRV